MLRRNRPVIKFMKSVEFVEEVGFEPGVKEWGSYGCRSCDTTISVKALK